MSEKLRIKFLSPWDVYNTEENATFDSDLAEKLIKAGKAEIYKDEKVDRKSPKEK